MFRTLLMLPLAFLLFENAGLAGDKGYWTSAVSEKKDDGTYAALVAHHDSDGNVDYVEEHPNTWSEGDAKTSGGLVAKKKNKNNQSVASAEQERQDHNLGKPERDKIDKVKKGVIASSEGDCALMPYAPGCPEVVPVGSERGGKGGGPGKVR